MSAPRLFVRTYFSRELHVRLKLTTRRLNMRILRRLACTAVYIERMYKSGSVSKTKGMRSHQRYYYAFRIIYTTTMHCNTPLYNNCVVSA